MRKTLGVPLAVLFALLHAVGALAASPPQKEFVPGELIVKFRAQATTAQRVAILADLGAQTLHHFDLTNAEHVRITKFDVEQAVARYRENPDITYIEPNYRYRAEVVPNDPQFGNLWGMQNLGQTGGVPGADISAVPAWSVFTGSANVLLAIIDTGVDYTHPDLAGNMFSNAGEVANNGIDDDGNGFIDDTRGWDFANGDNDPMDDNGHGTHVSGTCGAIGDNGIGVAGVNWTVRLLPIKFLDAGGSGTTDAAIQAVDYATRMGASVMNASWGGYGYSAGLRDAIARADSAGALFVTAAGNEELNTDLTPHYPSSYDLPNVISVAATNHNDQLAWFSNFGVTSVDLGAPGENVLSTLPGSSYGMGSGTSMASPHVAGSAALIRGFNPGADAATTKNLLLANVNPLPALAGVVATGGRLNVFAALGDTDTVAPAAVNSLAISNVEGSWAVLSWTAPGDDGNVGTANRYEIRRSAAPITAENFANATPVPGAPEPLPVGSIQSVQANGLAFSTTHYFALKAFDEHGNGSPLSNVVSVTTLPPPDISIAPASLSADLFTGQTASRTLSVANGGGSSLAFEITVEGAQNLAATTETFSTHPGEQGPVIARGVEVPLQQLLAAARGVPMQVSVPHDVDRRVGISSATPGTGHLVLSPTSEVFGNNQNQFFGGLRTRGNIFQCAASRVLLEHRLYLAPSVSAQMWFLVYEGMAQTGSYQLVSASNVTPAGSGLGWYSSGPINVNLVAGRFYMIVTAFEQETYYYNQMGISPYPIPASFGSLIGAAGWTWSPTTSFPPSQSQQVAPDAFGDVVAYYQTLVTNAGATWVRFSPETALVVPATSVDVGVTLDASGLLDGDYSAQIHVRSNDPDESDVAVPVQLHVTGAADVEVAPTAVNFGSLFIGLTRTDSVVVRNVGTADLMIYSLDVTPAVFSIPIASFSLSPGASRVLPVTFTPTSPGLANGVVTLYTDDADEQEVTLSLTGVGLIPPDIGVSPSSIAADLLTGQTAQRTLTISNTGGSPLTYEVGLGNVIPGAAVVQHAAQTVTKGAVDNRRGGPVTLGRGGPDQFGYQWLDSDEPGGPLFAWIPIDSIGTVAPLYGDDANFGPLPIGFEFPYYGQTFNTFRVCTNGWISFTSGSSTYGNQPLPSAGAPENLLSAFWADLYVPPNAIRYWSDGDRLVVQYTNVSYLGSGAPLTFQIVLRRDGRILYQYLAMTPPVTWGTVGIQNAELNDGLTVAFNTPYVHDGLAVQIAAAPTWLSADPIMGVVPAGGQAQVAVGMDATGMLGGDYPAEILVRSNDPDEAEVAVPVQLHVTGAPDVAVTPAAVNFGDLFVSQARTDSVVVRNIGTDLLTVSSITVAPAEFTAPTQAFALSPGAFMVLPVTFTPVVESTVSGMLTMNTNDPDAPVMTVPLAGHGLIPPEISVTPASFQEALLVGQGVSRTLNVRNDGGNPLGYEVSIQYGAPPDSLPDSLAVSRDQMTANGHVEGTGRTGPTGASGIEQLLVSARSRIAPEFVRFYDDMEHGSGDWTTVTYGGPDAWHRTTRTYNSPSHSWWCGSDSNGTYGFGERVNTAVITRSVDLRADVPPMNLFFFEWFDTEPGWDFCMVDASLDDGQNWFPLRGGRGQAPSGSSFGWRMTQLDLSAFVGHEIRLRFYFDTGDGGANTYPGWYFDDVMVARALSPWITVNPVQGTVPVGTATDLAVELDATTLIGGDYVAHVHVLNNDPDESDVMVPVQLHVTGVPDIAAYPAAVNFGSMFYGLSQVDSVVVRNEGTDALTVTSVSASPAVFTAPPAGFTLAPGHEMWLGVQFAPVAAGTVSGELVVHSNDPDEPTISIPLIGEGLVPPDVAVSPVSLAANLLTGQSAQRTLTISNTGGNDLIYRLELTAGGGGPVQHSTAAPLAKGVVDDRHGPPVTLGSGGPDQFGYRWRDSDESGGPAFDWIPIDSVGTPAPLYGDDGNYGPLPIGFDFPFYGQNFSTFRACTNGWISFTSSWATYSNTPLPSYSAPENMIAALWSDLYVPPDGIRYWSDGTRLVVQYTNVRYLWLSDPLTFQIVLYPTGRIAIQYLRMTPPVAWGTLGIQNATLSDGLTVAYNAAYVHDGLAVEIASTPPWLSASPTQGLVPPGGHADVIVGLDATGLLGGNYSGEVRVVSNDPDEAQVPVPALLHVIGAPDVAVTPTAFAFESLYVGLSRTDSLLVRNRGTDLLSVTGVETTPAAFTAPAAGFSLAPGAARMLPVTFAPLAGGAVNGTLTVRSNDPDAAALAIPLSGFGIVPPEISVTPTALNESLPPDQVAHRALTIHNDGGSDLAYSVIVQYGSDSSGFAPQRDQRVPETRVDGTGRPGPSGPSGLQALLAARLSSISPEFIRFHDDMENGPNGWTNVVSSQELWHQTTRTFTSPTHSWWCGDESRGTYDVGLVNNTLMSPAVDLVLYRAPITLQFFEWFDTEPGWDYCMVDVTTDGGTTWFPVRGTRGQAPSGSSGGWRMTQIDLSQFAGIEFRIGFHFDTGDAVANGYPGWYLDDVIITTAAPPWFSVSPVQGTVAMGGRVDLDARFDATGLEVGDYVATATIVNNDLDEGTFVVPASLHVRGLPMLRMRPDAIDFGETFVGWPRSVPVVLENVGQEPLVLTGLATTTAPFSVTPNTPLTLGPHDSTVASVRFAPTSAGARTSYLIATSNGIGSPDSVALSGIGVLPPQASVSPISVTAAATPGGVVHRSVRIRNDGAGPLTFSTQLLPAIPALPTAAAAVISGAAADEAAAGTPASGAAAEVDAVVASHGGTTLPGLEATGAPDAFGHIWRDSDDPDGPDFDWTDIRDTGELLPFSPFADDESIGPFPIGFPFPFYAGTFDSFRISANGCLSFTAGPPSGVNRPLPSADGDVVANFVAPMWDDQILPTYVGASVRVSRQANRLVIQYTNAVHAGQAQPPFNTYQVILERNGTITFQYLVVGVGKTSTTVGIQNGARDDGLTIAHNQSYLRDGLAVRIDPPLSWVHVTPKSAVVAPGGYVDLDLEFDSAGLANGRYDGRMVIADNDPARPRMEVPLVFHVAPPVVIGFDLKPERVRLCSRHMQKRIQGYLEPPLPFTPGDIDVASIRLNDVIAVDLSEGTEVGDFDHDGKPELKVVFPRGAVELLLPSGNKVPVEVTGLMGTREFVGYDSIRVKHGRVRHPRHNDVHAPGAIVQLDYDVSNTSVQWVAMMFSPDNGANWSMQITQVPNTGAFSWRVPNQLTDSALVAVVEVEEGDMGVDEVTGVLGVSDMFSIQGTLDAAVVAPVTRLLPPRPNPSGGPVRLEYAIAKKSEVDVAVFDLQGRQVAALARGIREAGTHAVVWDGRWETGARAGAGLYFVRLRVGGREWRERLVRLE